MGHGRTGWSHACQVVLVFSFAGYAAAGASGAVSSCFWPALFQSCDCGPCMCVHNTHTYLPPTCHPLPEQNKVLFGQEMRVNWAFQSHQREDTSSHWHIFVGDLGQVKDEKDGFTICTTPWTEGSVLMHHVCMLVSRCSSTP